MPEEASLQPRRTSRPLWERRWGLWLFPRTHLQQPRGRHWPPHRFSLPLTQPPAAAKPGLCTPTVGQTGLSLWLPVPSQRSPQHRPGRCLGKRLGTAAVVCRAAAPSARRELHTQQNPNLPKNLNKLARRSGSRAGTQILSSCLSHEWALGPGSPSATRGLCALWGGLGRLRRPRASVRAGLPSPCLPWSLGVPRASRQELPAPRKGEIGPGHLRGWGALGQPPGRWWVGGGCPNARADAAAAPQPTALQQQGVTHDSQRHPLKQGRRKGSPQPGPAPLPRLPARAATAAQQPPAVPVHLLLGEPPPPPPTAAQHFWPATSDVWENKLHGN